MSPAELERAERADAAREKWEMEVHDACLKVFELIATPRERLLREALTDLETAATRWSRHSFDAARSMALHHCCAALGDVSPFRDTARVAALRAKLDAVFVLDNLRMPEELEQ